MRSSKPNSKEGDKQKKLQSIKLQHQKWLSGMRDEHSPTQVQHEHSFDHLQPSEIKSSDIALDNWYGMSPKIVNARSNRDTVTCRLCISYIQKPTLLIP